MQTTLAYAGEVSFIENPHIFNIFEKIESEIEKRHIGIRAECDKYDNDDLESKKTCYAKYVKDYPVEITLDLFEGPSEKSVKAGKLAISWTDVETDYFILIGTYKLVYINESGNSTEIFSKKHLEGAFDSDYQAGIKPYTALGQKDGWIKLPQHPFPKSVWANFAKNGRSIKLIPLTNRALYLKIKTKTYTGIAILKKIENGFYLGHKFDASQIRPHPENDSCPDDSQELKFTPLKLEVKELYDENMHLKIDEEYVIPYCTC